METMINIWTPRYLSLKGKITIIRTLILPQIQFLFSSIQISTTIMKRIDKMLFDFLWNKKTAKVKRKTIIGLIEDGGLKMVDVYAVHTSAKFSWLRRLLDTTQGKWKTLMWKMLNISTRLLNKNPSDTIIKLAKSDFHKQIIEAWLKINKSRKYNLNTILNEYILYNKNITVGNKMINKEFLNSNEAINMKMWDLLDENGTFVNLNNLSEKLGKNIDELEYLSIKSAIPLKWKNKFRKRDMKINFNREDLLVIQSTLPKIYNKNKTRNIIKSTSKEIYWIIIEQKQEPPTATDTWINEFPFLETADWEKIYKISFKITCEPYLQSFQYKILNRILNCNERLHKWKITKENICTFCEEIDTIEHHLYECRESRLFWERLTTWMTNNLEVSFPLTICEIIFGFPEQNSSDIEIINYLILTGKWYINKMRTNKTELYLISYLHLVRKKVELLLLNNRIHSRTNLEWQEKLSDAVL